MGADIYLQSVNKKHRASAERNFNKWVKKRNEAPEGPERDKAQAKVAHYYDAMYAHGYFRDSYNGSSLFWLLDLSWWDLAKELQVDDEGYLPIAGAITLQERLKALSVEERFPAWVKDKREEGWKFEGEDTPEAWKQAFIERKQAFEDLLAQSIQLKEPLYWSV